MPPSGSGHSSRATVVGADRSSRPADSAIAAWPWSRHQTQEGEAHENQYEHQRRRVPGRWSDRL